MATGVPSTRAIAKVFFTLVALSALTYLLYLVRSILGLVAISVFLAIALGPAVDFFHRRRVPRALSIVVVYLLIVAAIFGVGLLIVPPVVTQVKHLSRDIPGYLDDLRHNKQFRKYDNKYDITAKLKQQARKLPQRLGEAAGALKSVTVGVFSTIVKLVTVLSIVFFLLLDGKRLMAFVFRLIGPARERRFRPVAEDIYRATAGYVAGNLLISVIAGSVTYATLLVLDVPFRVPLAVLMAFLDLIPLVGATIGGIAIALVTVATDFPSATIVWLIVFLVYQQLENNILQPIVYRRTVAVPPLVVIIAVLIGGSLMGVLGALVAIPIAAALQILVRDWWRNRNGAIAPVLPGPGAGGPAPEPPPVAA